MVKKRDLNFNRGNQEPQAKKSTMVDFFGFISAVQDEINDKDL